MNVFGAKGFVGGHYAWRNFLDNNLQVKDRNDYTVTNKDVLYFISTVDNYNIHESSHIDIDTNLTVLMNVLDNWRSYQKKTGTKGVFNYISSWFVYGNQPLPHLVKEDAYCDPKGFYSITKRCAEQLLISYCTTFGLKYRIMRLGNVLGAGDKKVSAKKNALQYIIGRLKNNEPVELYNDGNFYRDYIDVDDVANAIRLVVERGQENEIYNVGNGFDSAWKFRDIILYARRVLNSSSRITSIPAKDFHKKIQVETFCMDNLKLKSLGYQRNYTMEQTIDSLL